MFACREIVGGLAKKNSVSPRVEILLLMGWFLTLETDLTGFIR